MDGTLATVTLFAGNFVPRNWASCSGQLIAIRQNTALFSLLGTTYGGDGKTTFGLPDLRGRAVIGQGQGPGLSDYTLGEATGTETNTLNVGNLPAHNHAGTATITQPISLNGNDSQTPQDSFPAAASVTVYTSGPVAGQFSGAASVTATLMPAGGNSPMNNMQPTLGLGYIICMYGVFPARG
ncbi:phage tail protein [Taibaiella chishuiensis]|uniref:Microcystin-dependent protein n=1 Tax=Taibaiella chishuiensis TaxID=1434707 RepID=A0A2P8D2H5_9BACT|nr:tail fiber protein [Taibaiella chishuiensis]PSK91422.1 microcystin-dependent protein [Taibaiella chishuiensis]